jgi:transposase
MRRGGARLPWSGLASVRGRVHVIAGRGSSWWTPAGSALPHAGSLVSPGRRACGVSVRHRSPYRDRLRAQIVLDAAGDYTNAAIARRRRVTQDTVRKWRGRFAAEGPAGLIDRKRTGRPPRFTAVQRAQVTALACHLPATTAVPLSRRSSAELAEEAVSTGVVESICPGTVRRWLRRDALKPWQFRSWIAPRAPDVAPRAARRPRSVCRFLQRRTARR